MGIGDELRATQRDLDQAGRDRERRLAEGEGMRHAAAAHARALLDESIAYLAGSNLPYTQVVLTNWSSSGRRWSRPSVDIVGRAWQLASRYLLTESPLLYDTGASGIGIRAKVRRKADSSDRLFSRGISGARLLECMKALPRDRFPDGTDIVIVDSQNLPLGRMPSELLVVNADRFSMMKGRHQHKSLFQPDLPKMSMFGVLPNGRPAFVEYTPGGRDQSTEWLATDLERWLTDQIKMLIRYAD